jgi:hypothetical protein
MDELEELFSKSGAGIDLKIFSRETNASSFPFKPFPTVSESKSPRRSAEPPCQPHVLNVFETPESRLEPSSLELEPKAESMDLRLHRLGSLIILHYFYFVVK